MRIVGALAGYHGYLVSAVAKILEPSMKKEEKKTNCELKLY